MHLLCKPWYMMQLIIVIGYFKVNYKKTTVLKDIMTNF